MSTLEIIIVVCFAVGCLGYIALAIYDLKHPERKELKKQKKLEKKKAKENNENNEEGKY